jgi:hypothetical protein
MAVALLLIVGVGGYALYRYSQRYLHGTACTVSAGPKENGVELDLEQAANAATIAAVARQKKLPEQALVVAYATVIQESKIHNLQEGDRDSVGLFQQRPSQGWGSPQDLTDPVYATGKFFDALKKVRHYQKLPVDVAAQDVQHSADGSAYALHVDNAKILAAGFDGRQPASVNCWYAPDRQTASRRGELPGLLEKSFGQGKVTVSNTPDGLTIDTNNDPQYGWALASWAVSYAQGYGIREIRYAGRRWVSDNAYAGWTEDKTTPGTQVIVR